MDIYERIEADHDLQRELANKLVETQGDGPERRQLWERLRPEVEAHAAAEEQTFYAELIQAPSAQEQARHSISEHKEAADLIEELESTDMASGAWLTKFKKLKEELEHHMDEEENDVFALAREAIDDARADELATEFDERKQSEQQEA